jgi:hypothetical protein
MLIINLSFSKSSETLSLDNLLVKYLCRSSSIYWEDTERGCIEGKIVYVKGNREQNN